MTEVATFHYDAQQWRGVGQWCGIGLFVGRKSEMLHQKCVEQTTPAVNACSTVHLSHFFDIGEVAVDVAGTRHIA